MVVDLVTMRPVGIAAIGVCWLLYIPVLPFAFLGRNTKAATQKLIKEPWNFTMARPIGVF
jgi:hypothetical protein